MPASASRARQRGAPAHHVHHQFGADLLAGLGAHAAHVRHAGPGRPPEAQPGDRRAPPDRHTRMGGGHCGQGRFDQRSPPGEHLDVAILRALGASDELGDSQEGVVALPSSRLDGLSYLGQLGFEDGAVAGHEEVGEPELVDAPAAPFVPGVERGWRRVGVTLEDRHLVAVLGQ